MADKKQPAGKLGTVLGVIALVFVIVVVISKGCELSAHATRSSGQATNRATDGVPMNWQNRFFIATAYSPSEDETDSAPCESADQSDICALYAEGKLSCAQNDYPLGTIIDVPGYGRCVVRDRMNERFTGQRKIDVFLPTKEEANEWGRQRLKVVIWTPASGDDGTGWACPTEEHEITSGWGMRKLKRRKHAKFHAGMDLEADAGDKTFTVAAGEVTRAGSYGDCGQTVDITHDDGLMTRYCHHAELKVSVGQRVARGEQIGIAGQSGNAQGIHLHFEVLKGDEQVNPETRLPRRCWEPGGDLIAKK